MTESSPNSVEAANAALGALEMEAREILVHDKDALEAVLQMLVAKRGEVVARLAAGEALGTESRSVAYRCADGCYEALVFDANDRVVSRRRYPSSETERWG